MSTKPNPFNKITNYLVLGFLLYAIYASYGKPQTLETNVLPKDVAHLYEPIPQNTTPVVSDKWSKVMDMVGQSIRPRMDVVTQKEGTGDSPICGQTIVYDFVDSTLDGNTTLLAKENVKLRFGVDPMTEGHRRALLDMKPGGNKTVQYPSVWGYTDSGPKEARSVNLMSKLTLRSVSPEPPRNVMPFRIYVNPPKISTDAFSCGDKVSVQLTFWSVDGKRLFPESQDDTAPVSIRIGQADAPFGVELGLQMLTHGDAATLILPPEFLTFFNVPNAESALRERFKKIKFPAGQAIIVDLAVPGTLETPAGGTQKDSGTAPTQSAPAQPLNP